MAFTLSVKGKNTINFGENMITSASIDVNTPINSMAKLSSMSALLHITGNFVPSDAVNTLTQGNSETKALLDWSLVPATNSEAYCDVTINVITAGTTFRTIQFPNALLSSTMSFIVAIEALVVLNCFQDKKQIKFRA